MPDVVVREWINIVRQPVFTEVLMQMRLHQVRRMFQPELFEMNDSL
jgi:hypothetical protein